MRGVGELAELAHLAVPEREDVAPFGARRLSGLAHVPAMAAEHEHLVAGGMELARLELGVLQVLGDTGEELPGSLWSLEPADGGKVRLPPMDLPVGIVRQRSEDRGDLAALERGIEALRH